MIKFNYVITFDIYCAQLEAQKCVPFVAYDPSSNIRETTTL